jgi:hypothetical protein
MSILVTKAVFIITLITGLSLYIFAAFIALPTIIQHLIPIASLLIYAVLIYIFPKERRDVSDADNAYYMGFIFTMTSLAFSLYQIQTDASNNINVSKLVQSFGVALSSTIFGIFLRIILSPRRQDIDSQEDLARTALQDSVHGFCDVLNESTQSLKMSYEAHVNGFTQSISQASDTLVKGIELFNLKSSTVFHDIVDLLEKSLPKTLEKVDESFTQHSKSIERNTAKIHNVCDVQLASILKTNELIKEHTEKLERSTSLMSKALDELSNKISSVRIDSDTIERHVKSVFMIYESAAKTAGVSLTQSSETIKSLVEALVALPNQIDDYIDSKDKQQHIINDQFHKHLLNISDLLNRNLLLFQNLPNTLESNLRPILKLQDDSKHGLSNLQNTAIAIENASNSIKANIDFTHQENINLTTNIYSATYEILKVLNNSRTSLDSAVSEQKSQAV